MAIRNKGQCRYTFCEIPNTEEGQLLVKLMRKYLNADRYNIRVRGQYMNSEAKKNWRRWEMGQPINLSTHLRVYLEENEL